MDKEQQTKFILEFLLLINLWLLFNDLIIGIKNMTSYMTLITLTLIVLLLLNRKRTRAKK